MRFAIALMTAVSISALAMAQEPAPPFPVVNDLADGWETGGQPMPVDILGLKIGMPRDAAVAAAATALEADPATGILAESESGIAGEYGVSVVFRYPYQFRIEKAVGQQRDMVELYFTTGVSGERLSSLRRAVYWDGGEKPRTADVVASLKEKYGEPSATNESQTVSIYYWAYRDGQKISVPPGTYVGDLSSNDVPENCLATSINGLRTYSYSDEGPRAIQALLKSCTVTIVAQVNEDYSAPGLIGSMSVDLSGGARMYENAVATDAFLNAELAKKVSEQPSGPAAPKL